MSGDGGATRIDLSTYTHPAGGHGAIGWGRDPFLTPGDVAALIDGLYYGYLRVVETSPYKRAAPLDNVTRALEGRASRAGRRPVD